MSQVLVDDSDQYQLIKGLSEYETAEVSNRIAFQSLWFSKRSRMESAANQIRLKLRNMKQAVFHFFGKLVDWRTPSLESTVTGPASSPPKKLLCPNPTLPVQ